MCCTHCHRASERVCAHACECFDVSLCVCRRWQTARRRSRVGSRGWRACCGSLARHLSRPRTAQHSTAQGRTGQGRSCWDLSYDDDVYRMTCGGDRSAAQRRAVCGARQCGVVLCGSAQCCRFICSFAQPSYHPQIISHSPRTASERAFHSRAADRQIDAADSRPALKHQISHSLPMIPLSSRRTLAVPRACIVTSGRGPHWRQHRSRRAAPSTSQASRPGRGPAPSARSEFPRFGEA
eukprot:COSAG06_NODE_3252_length_5612_cov_786.685652_8_plen_238_part_00